MATAAPPAIDERLPWLEPYRDPIAAKRPFAPMIGKNGVALIFGAIVSVAIALMAGYFLGQRQQPELPASGAEAASTTAAVRHLQPATSAAVAAPPSTVEPAQIAITPPMKSAHRTVNHPPGQLVQLGAFQTRRRALFAHRLHMKQHPGLASMPHIVVPVTSKPSGRVLYALRLGTASRQQSREVCRNMRASGDDCLVIG
ncbi:MAG: hypothetical protein V4696_01090 [Pseudomonadota bacterium]